MLTGKPHIPVHPNYSRNHNATFLCSVCSWLSVCVHVQYTFLVVLATGLNMFYEVLCFSALLQMMAAAVVCRDLCYFTFGDEALLEKLHDMHLFITSQDLGVCEFLKLNTCIFYLNWVDTGRIAWPVWQMAMQYTITIFLHL